MGDLLALSRAEQERAKALLARRFYAHGVTLLLGLISLLLEEPLVYMTAIGAVLSESAAWWLRHTGREAHALAEDARRRAMVARELGQDVDTLSTAQMLTQFSEYARKTSDNWADPDYYTAVDEPGPERLRRSLQESAFWSARLYHLSARRGLLALAGIVTLIVVATLLVVLIEVGDAGTLAARAATVTFATLVGVDELGVVLSLFSAGRVAERVVRQLDHVDVRDLGQMLVVFADYSVATNTAAPIPTGLYKAQHAAITAAWESR